RLHPPSDGWPSPDANSRKYRASANRPARRADDPFLRVTPLKIPTPPGPPHPQRHRSPEPDHRAPPLRPEPPETTSPDNATDPQRAPSCHRIKNHPAYIRIPAHLLLTQPGTQGPIPRD